MKENEYIDLDQLWQDREDIPIRPVRIRQIVSMRDIAMQILHIHKWLFAVKQASVIAFGMRPEGGVIQSETDAEDWRQTIRQSLDHLEEGCKQLNLRTTIGIIDYLKNRRTSFRVQVGEDLSGINQGFIRLFEVLEEEIATKLFLHFSHREQELWEDLWPFGNEVNAVLPSAAYDVEEAAKCLAMQRHTACAFHCMRAVEEGMKALYKNVTKKDFDPREIKNWGQCLGAITNVIKAAHPDYKTAKEPEIRFYKDAIKLLELFRETWRNTTMHADKKYLPDEAEHIFINARAFMQKLAKQWKA